MAFSVPVKEKVDTSVVAVRDMKSFGFHDYRDFKNCGFLEIQRLLGFVSILPCKFLRGFTNVREKYDGVLGSIDDQAFRCIWFNGNTKGFSFWTSTYGKHYREDICQGLVTPFHRLMSCTLEPGKILLGQTSSALTCTLDGDYTCCEMSLSPGAIELLIMRLFPSALTSSFF